MRIVSANTFAGLPVGTIYKKALKPWAWEDMHIKGDTLPAVNFDFTCLPLDNPENSAGETNVIDAWFRMQATRESARMSVDAWGRDGCFDTEAQFLIYEEQDLLALRSFIDEAISLCRSVPA